MHKTSEAVESAAGVPVLHIADAAAERIKSAGLGRIGLLGTLFTMEEDFYKERLITKHGLEVVLPSREDRQVVHRIIYEELCQGIVAESSRVEYVRIMERMREEGAQGAILGCTEIGLLVGQKDVDLPLFDTTVIHAEWAADWALQGEAGSEHHITTV